MNLVTQITMEQAANRFNRDLPVLAITLYEGEDGYLDMAELRRMGKKDMTFTKALCEWMLTKGMVEFFIRKEWIDEEGSETGFKRGAGGEGPSALGIMAKGD